MTELDSVPGGIGLTAFLNRLYAHGSPAGVPSNAATESAARVQDKVNWSSPWIAVAHAQNDGAVPPDQGHLLATLAASYGKLTNYFQSDVDGKALTGHNIEGNFVMSPSIDRMFDCRVAGTIAC